MKKILLIDDEEMIRKFIHSILKLEDYILEEVSSADPVPDMLNSDPPDSIISDLFLPGKDGFKLIEEVRRDFPAVKIIAITGGGLNLFDSETALNSAKRSGADFTLMKPFKRKNLLAAIQTVIGQDSHSSLNNEKQTQPKGQFH